MAFQLVARTGHPDFLDLPWDRPLEAWETPRIAHVPRGISRHVVRFVRYGDDADGFEVYAVKELPERLARREYRLLTQLRGRGLPAVEAVGVAAGRRDGETGGALSSALLTRHLPFSLPYRWMFAHTRYADLHERLVDALVDLLTRLHLAGFLWGDCSLSNALFRRDASRLAAYLVDAETGELHERLTDGQRGWDVELARTNVAGELADLAAAGDLPDRVDPFGLADDLAERYTRLWTELTRVEELHPDEHYRVHERLRRLNDLGYDVDEVELVETGAGSARLRLSVHVVDRGHHRRRLAELTGLEVQEEQARRLLGDLANFGAWLHRAEGASLPESELAARWLAEAFEPTVAAVPAPLRVKRDPAQLYHEILDHWYFQSTIEGHDLELADAARSYAAVLEEAADERTLLPGPDAAADEVDDVDDGGTG